MLRWQKFLTPSLSVLVSLSPTADLGTPLVKADGRSDDTHHSENPLPVLSQAIVNSTGIKLPHPGSHPKLALAQLGATDADCQRSLNDLSFPRRFASRPQGGPDQLTQFSFHFTFLEAKHPVVCPGTSMDV